MKAEAITEETIQKLVDTFYERVRADRSLGPIFRHAIGEGDAWKPHLQKMYDFWSSIMLGSGRYHGNPFMKHRMLPHFESSLFDRWLALFEKTAKELFDDEIANRFIERSYLIARNLKSGLYPEERKGLL